MINSSFEVISGLQLRLKAKQRIIDEFKSGERYVKMEKEYRKNLRYVERLLKKAKYELGKAHAETISVRKAWMSVVDDCLKELDIMGKQLFDLQMDNARLKKELYEAKVLHEEEKEKNAALTARINKDHTNSSKSSSSNPNHATIYNSREKTGRKPGGQPGHEHHPRKRHQPDHTIPIQAPEEYLDKSMYTPTGRIIKKQLVKVHLITEVIEYQTPEFRNKKTGQRVHAPFPDGIVCDVNYDGTVKALAYMLNNECCVSVSKTQRFINEVSQDKLSISTGLISNLSKQFSEKTEDERNEIFLELMSSPIMHADFTFGRVAGKQGAVIITATPEGKIMYQARSKKGDEGVKGSPLEFYDGTVVSDHESAIIKHGKRHQECLAHIRRYMQASIENEKDKTWSADMLAWIKASIHYWNQVNDGMILYSETEAERLIAEYDRIIAKAKDEYDYVPPTDYYRDGYNTYVRMLEDKESYILFLRDPSVPPTNNLAERSGRRYKRKNAQVMSFRSQKGAEYFCDGLTVTESIKSTGGNLYNEITDRFNWTKE